ncbi:reverse transcriptase domain-containing protein [Tanacetum coccineum]
MFRKKLENPRSVTTLRVQNTKRKRGIPKGTKVREEWTKEYSIDWEARKKVCPHTRKAATKVPAQEERNPSPENVTIKEHVHEGQRCFPKVKTAGRDTESQNRKSKGQALKRTTYHNHGSLKYLQAAAKVEQWAMPTWCHMFNSTLTGSARVWFDDLPPKSVVSYDDLKKEFLANFLQQKKCIKDPVEIHHIKQREGESTEDSVQRFKAESRHVKGALECMRISRFMQGITNPELIKRLHDNIPKSVDEMMRVTTAFLRGEVAASNQVRKKTLLAWKQQEAGRKQNFKRMGDFRNQQRSERRRDKFTLLTKSLKEILALDKGKFKTPPPMTTPVEKRNNNKLCEFHREVGHNTNECMHLRRQIEELIKNGKLSHVIKELKQGSGKDQPKAAKKGETSGKDKPLAILMVQPWQRVARQRITDRSKESNGSSYHTPHWFQQRNHMANETNIAASKNRGCGAFNLYMDEFYGGEIAISIQWDHRKARGGILTLRSNRIIPLECIIVSGPEAKPSSITQATEERIRVAIHLEYLEQTIVIGSTLTEEGRKALCELLKRNLDIFSWKPEDMTGVSQHLAKHFLNAREGCLPARQNKRSQAPKRNKAIQEEVEKLIDAGIMKEVHYHSWLSNPVMVDKVFQKKIGRNLEVYVDDLVIKNRTEQEIIRDIEETFRTLREINMKLNPKKCTFRVEEGMFLGYKKSDFQWTAKAEAAFKQMKKIIAELPTLTAPMEKEELILYLAAAREAVRAVLMTEREAKQMPVYFISRACKVLSKPEITGRLQKWSIELGNMTYSTGQEHQFDATNNEAEYEALIAGLRIAEQIGIKNLQANVDSRLVANQVNGSYIAKESGLIQYLEKVKTLASSFKKFLIRQVPRSENKKADALSKTASTSFAHLTKQVLVEELNEKSINEKEYARQNKIDGSKSHTDVILLANNACRCKKNDSGMSRFPGSPPPAKKPTTKTDSHHFPVAILQWRIDVARPFLEEPGKVKFLIVAIDYFTKWIEAKPVATITGNQIKKFVWDNIVCRFGLPREIISDNGKQFRDNPFKDWCENLCICQRFAFVKHPQANDLVKRANRSLGKGIKAWLDERSKDWIEEVPHNDEALEINLDLLEEIREQAAIREARSKAKMEKYYDFKVRNTSFKRGDLVYRNNDASHAKDSGNLGPK